MLAMLEQLPRCVIDPAKDRVHVLAWVGREVTSEQLAEAHRRAAAARDRDDDRRPVYAAFLARFIDEVLAPARGSISADADRPWYEREDGVMARADELEVRPKKRDEHWQSYRVVVVNASRESAAVEFVLRDAKRFNDERLYQFARETFGDALMPVDDYAS